MQYGVFDVAHAREIARNSRRTRDMRQPARRQDRRELPSMQPFWIGKADANLVYSSQPTTVQSVSVTLWDLDEDEEVENAAVQVDAYDWLGNGCLKGEPLFLYRRSFGTGNRYYFTGTWSAIIGKGTITARSGTTPGSGTLDWWDVDSSGVLADTGEDVTVKNLATSATSGTAFLQCKKVRGIWFVDFEECES